ncbi:MAG TPA: hypothetical protein VGM41_19240 [Chitinophagaceae bacterium]|jgi:hypothetical protein
MTENFLLRKVLVQRIAKATNALLIVQWAHEDVVSKQWDARDPDQCGTSHTVRYWVTVVVKDDEPRSTRELMQAGKTACKGHGYVAVHILRKKEALRKLNGNHGDFAIIYRLGYPIYNTDKKVFPRPGHARKEQSSRQSLHAKRA